ncbi:hypothetical protein ES708_19538 [subsurface metagenome]
MIIKPKKGWQLVDFKELSEYRDLFYFLVARDIKVRYKQIMLGGLWAIIQPFFSMIVFTLFFGRLAKIPSDGIPYPVFNFSAMVAWTYFANAVTNSGNSLIINTNLISKVYLPLLVILMMLTASGVGMLLAALNAKYRDIRYTIPFLVQLWMFASPIVYPASMLPEKYRLAYALNPMVGVVEGFRSALLGTIAFPKQILLISTLVSVILFIAGIFYFKQTERYFADII